MVYLSQKSPLSNKFLPYRIDALELSLSKHHLGIKRFVSGISYFIFCFIAFFC